MPLIYIIILNWNSFEDTQQLLLQLRQLTYQNFKIVLVDNDSNDNSGKRLNNEFRNIEYIQTGSNLGYAGGNNIGIKHAIHKNAEYIWILNNDILITDFSTLETLLEEYKKLETVAFFGLKLLDSNDQKIQFIRATVGNSGFPQHHYAGEIDLNLNYKKIEETDHVHGASMFFNADIINKIGYMDELYFLYFEEVDWCMKAKSLDYKNYTLTSTFLSHKFQFDKAHMYYYMYRNYIYFSRHFKIKIHYWHHLKEVLKIMIRRSCSRRPNSWKQAYAVFRGTIHGLLGKRGK